MCARRTGKHRGAVLQQLNSAVERLAGNHVEGDIEITVVDPVVAGAPGDHGEDDHPETVHEACLEERPAQAETANGAHRAVAFPLHRSHSLDRILADQPGIGPRERRLQRRGEQHLGSVDKLVHARLVVGGIGP